MAKTACIILAAGLGKRMRSDTVKVLHPICGEPMLDYPVALAIKKGYGPIVVVVGRQAEAVQEHLRERFGQDLRFVVQDPPRGTGDAVMKARKALGKHRGKVAILYGDVPLLGTKELSALTRAGKKAPVAFLTCRLGDPSGYGRVLRDGRGQVEAIVEHRDASAAQRRIDEINTGIYLMDGKVLFAALGRVGKRNAQGEFYLTDVVELARESGHLVAGVEVNAESMQGVNDRLELAEVNRIMNRRLAEDLMRKGVSILDPDRVVLGPRVRVGADSELWPGCVLQGEVRIGKGCIIGPGAVIRNSRAADGSEVRAYSILDEARVGRDCQVGPFARLRPGSRLAARVKVGNFVECKKTQLGEGSKASHLSYLGDADIGRDVNVGAGTITCNYDGRNKFVTRIEDGAFIGSDSQLVAPVTVGKESYVGAGSTITVDVPDGSLAITRVKQRNIPGYAKRKNGFRRNSKKKS